MWAICTNVYKKRRVEFKRKNNRTKRKIFYDLPNHSKRLKSKSNHCLIHEEQYICDIYECSGVYSHQLDHFMPYIN